MVFNIELRCETQFLSAGTNCSDLRWWPESAAVAAKMTGKVNNAAVAAEGWHVCHVRWTLSLENCGASRLRQTADVRIMATGVVDVTMFCFVFIHWDHSVAAVKIHTCCSQQHEAKCLLFIHLHFSLIVHLSWADLLYSQRADPFVCPHFNSILTVFWLKGTSAPVSCLRFRTLCYCRSLPLLCVLH